MSERTPTYFTAIARFHRFSPKCECFIERLFTKIENQSIKNLFKVMMVADISARRPRYVRSRARGGGEPSTGRRDWASQGRRLFGSQIFLARRARPVPAASCRPTARIV